MVRPPSELLVTRVRFNELYEFNELNDLQYFLKLTEEYIYIFFYLTLIPKLIFFGL